MYQVLCGDFQTSRPHAVVKVMFVPRFSYIDLGSFTDRSYVAFVSA